MSLSFAWAHPPFCTVTRAEDQAQLLQGLAACPAPPPSCSTQSTLSSGLGLSGHSWMGCFLITKSAVPISSSHTPVRHILASLNRPEEREGGYKTSLPDLKPCSSKPPRGEQAHPGPAPPPTACLLNREWLHHHCAMLPPEHSSPILKQSSGKTTRDESRKKDSAEKGAQSLEDLAFPHLILEALASPVIVSKETSQ